MHRYLAKRLLLAIPTIFGLTLLIFFSLRVLPELTGDSAASSS